MHATPPTQVQANAAPHSTTRVPVNPHTQHSTTTADRCWRCVAGTYIARHVDARTRMHQRHKGRIIAGDHQRRNTVLVCMGGSDSGELMGIAHVVVCDISLWQTNAAPTPHTHAQHAAVVWHPSGQHPSAHVTQGLAHTDTDSHTTLHTGHTSTHAHERAHSNPHTPRILTHARQHHYDATTYIGLGIHVGASSQQRGNAGRLPMHRSTHQGCPPVLGIPRRDGHMRVS